MARPIVSLKRCKCGDEFYGRANTEMCKACRAGSDIKRGGVKSGPKKQAPRHAGGGKGQGKRV